MKAKLKPRELVWMTLPVALIGGTALWLSSGGGNPLNSANVRRAVTNARRPSLSLQEVRARWVSPTQAAFEGRTVGCQLSVLVNAWSGLTQARPANAPGFSTTNVFDDRERSLNTTLIKPGTRVPPHNVFSGGTSWGTVAGQSVPNTTYTVGATIPLTHLPKSTQRGVFTGTINWGTATPLQVKYEVAPTWMCRAAKRLQIKEVTWEAYPSDSGGEIRVVCQLSNPRQPHVFGVSPGVTTYPVGIGIGYDPRDWKDPKYKKDSDTILAEWSQRVESGDGHLNSLHLLSRHMYKREMSSMGSEKRLNSFDPLSKAPNVEIKNAEIHLTYGVSRIPKTFKYPVFRCEIFLVGDGMIKVSCPLKTEPSKEAS